MTQIEQIKDKIERLKAEIPYHENVWSVLDKLKEFINSLPAEQPSEELQILEKDVANKYIDNIDRKRICITLKGETKAKFKNEFNTLWQTVGNLQFANVAKEIIEKLCLNFAAWGAYNLRDYVDMEEKEKAKMDTPIEQPSEDLETSIMDYMNHVPEQEPESSETLYTYEQMQEIARHFAQWQKEQMIKSAIGAIITSRWKGSHVCLTTNKDIPQIYNGDRVKIQIIKEDK